MIGSLILHSKSSNLEVLPVFTNYETGSHTPGRTNGTWFLQTTLNKSKVYLPQRDKELSVYTDLNYNIETIVKGIDSLPGARYLDKLNALARNLTNAQLIINSEGDHGTWSILGNNISYVVVRSAKSTQLVWSSENLIDELRRSAPLGYTFYRLPSMNACFLNTQALCSRFWRWINVKDLDTLKVMNALEVFLDGKVK